MPTNHTTNYRLSQWEKSDKVQMEDFNADNAKIDAALGTLRDGKAEASEVPRLDAAIAAKVSIVTGTYQGDDQESQFIDLGFTPRAVLSCRDTGAIYNNSSYYGGLALTDHPARYFSDPILSIVEGGFMAHKKIAGTDKILANSASCIYYYIAFR